MMFEQFEFPGLKFNRPFAWHVDCLTALAQTS